MHFDASIYRANPNDSEEGLEEIGISIYVVTFGKLTQDKVPSVGEFAHMTGARPGDWPTVQPHVASALGNAGGKHCVKFKMSDENLVDFRLQVSTPHAKTVIAKIATEMAKHNLKLRKTARL
ncbi:MAG: hypothetical protein ABWX90_03980 [Candidatus Saccharimonadales bacterium]